MKYVMLQTDEGAKLPFLFPEGCTHVFVAAVMRQMLLHTQKTGSEVVSAGFVDLGTTVAVRGESESLGGLPHNPCEGARIILGEAMQYMPDELVEVVLDKLLAAAQNAGS